MVQQRWEGAGILLLVVLSQCMYGWVDQCRYPDTMQERWLKMILTLIFGELPGPWNHEVFSLCSRDYGEWHLYDVITPKPFGLPGSNHNRKQAELHQSPTAVGRKRKISDVWGGHCFVSYKETKQWVTCWEEDDNAWFNRINEYLNK